MNSHKDCRFCDIVNGKYRYNRIDQPFAESDSYIAIASIGALIEGWSLIIPKKHQLSMKRIYERKDFEEFTNIIIRKLTRQYGSLIAFEHGSNKEGSITACGTDHAHLHIVPFKDSLIEDLNRSGLDWLDCHASEINDKTMGSEYLFYYDLGLNNAWKDPIGKLHVLKAPISQFFRHVIADRLGDEKQYDYKNYPNLNIAELTQKHLSEVVYI